MRKYLIVFSLIIPSLSLVGCKFNADTPNPASVYCEENGGTLEIREDETDGQVGYCQFPDGSECEEWSFYRGDCNPGDSLNAETGLPNPASVYCLENGGTLEIREDGTGGQVGYCVFSDGSKCEEWSFYREECQIGEN